MPRFSKTYATQGLNALLRMATMAVKMGLTLYMGRYFSLADMGTYGLVLGAVSILTVFLGQNFAYIVNRDIVGAPETEVCHKIRDEILFYGINFAAFFVIILILALAPQTWVSSKTLMYVFALTVLEGYGAVAYFNQNSLHKQLRANALFFIRSGLWVIPVVVLCVFFPGLRTADAVLLAWIAGSASSLIVTAWLWRAMPWREAWQKPIDWAWIGRGARTTILVWLGMLGITCGSFLDRFVVEHYLTIQDVGVLTFYFSFTNAMLTLMQSGVAAFATPRMIQHHRDNAHEEFHKEARHASRQINVGAGLMAIGLCVFVPLLSYLMKRPALIAGMGTFLMMAFAAWLRANADMKSNILFARHQDRAIWLGNLLFLVPALGGNLLFVPLLGFKGIGFSAIAASAFLLAWRWKYAKALEKNYER